MAVGGAAAAAALLVSPSPPLYDGLGLPEEPYRLVGEDPAPAGAERRLPITSTSSPPVYLATPETGPQAAVALPAGALEVGAGSGELVVRITPVRPDHEPPGKRLGNAYRLHVTLGGVPVVARPDVPRLVVQLRIPAATDVPVDVVLREDGRWSRLATRRTGEHVYTADLPAFGEVAAVEVGQSFRAAPYGAGSAEAAGGLLLLIPVGGAVALLGVALLLRGRRRTGTSQELRSG